MTKEEIKNILDELDDLTSGLNTAENALEAFTNTFTSFYYILQYLLK